MNGMSTLFEGLDPAVPECNRTLNFLLRWAISLFLSLASLPPLPSPFSLSFPNSAWMGFLPQATYRILHSHPRGGREVTEVKWTAGKEVSPDLVSTKSCWSYVHPSRGKYILHRGKGCWQEGYCQTRRMSVGTLACVLVGRRSAQYGWNADGKLQVTFSQPQKLDHKSSAGLLVFSLLFLLDGSSWIMTTL